MPGDAFNIDTSVEITQQGSTPPVPDNGNMRFYPGTSGHFYSLANSGVQTQIAEATIQATATQNLNAGDWVNLDPASGSVCQANAATEGVSTDGFVRSAWLANAVATVHVLGINDQLTGLTGGRNYFLSNVAGVAALAPAVGSGTVFQKVGVALSATQILFQRGEPVTRA
jgi:hypothetical protein